MCAALLGGMDRLRTEYIATAREYGWKLRCISRNEKNFTDKIGHPDAVIVFTNKISHEAKRKAVQIAKSKQIPLRMKHSCGLSSLRECFDPAHTSDSF